MLKNHNPENKLREIAKLPDVPDLSDELVIALTNLCFYQSPLTNSDLLFVFGSNILHKEIATEITKIVSEFGIATVVITGGVANYTLSHFEPTAESELILSHINKEAIPHTQFIIENKSKNTLENIAFSKCLFDFSNVRKVTFLSHSYASMRSCLTLKRYCNLASFGNAQIKIPSDILNISVGQDNWYKTAHGRQLVWGEYLRFQTYGERGDFPIKSVLNTMNNVKRLIRESR
ncbi:ElyC/SanA/YdcF family protein [Sphingobacterium deserti]|uniref:DUF218 domain-containing protein n=1 Tax=Sphingobacterium deserti TaxID=1229276 RepID=A0A0B8TCC6_9SPHI|nr:ElyC/SanA/YdcF family protein [Sphingobacterium deserti]KGE16030.1 hypothetical protein DI53_0145 [Sphingobacterium deserti]